MNTQISAPTLSTRSVQFMQQWMRYDGRPFSLTIPALVVCHFRRGLHLSLKAACERLALEAEQMAQVAKVDHYARQTAEYIAAKRYLDDVCELLSEVGWDYANVADPDGSLSYGGKPRRMGPPPPRDVSVSLYTGLQPLHDALTREIEDLRVPRLDDEISADTSLAQTELAGLLETLNGWVEEAHAADRA